MTGGIYCGLLLAFGIQSAECSLPTILPVPETRTQDPSFYAVPPAPAPIPPAKVEPPPPPPPAPPTGAIRLTGVIEIEETGGGSLPIEARGTVVEISSTPGDGIAVNFGGAMADAGVPVTVPIDRLADVEVVGIRRGNYTLRIRSLGPGGWSQAVSAQVLVHAPPAVVPRVDPEAERRARMLAILKSLGVEGIRARGPGHAAIPDEVPPSDFGAPRDADYGRLGLKSDPGGYPVNRERMITADRYISAVLEHRINSQIPGRAVLVVDRPVFGGDGWKVLLEAGTKVVCKYDPLEQEGDTRLPLVCDRLIRPDGVSIVMKELVAGDAMASAGLPGNVDNRVWERYGAALIAASMAALASVGKEAIDQPIAGGAAQSYTDALGDATAKILDKNINLAPIITIPAGTRLTLQPTRDIVLIN